MVDSEQAGWHELLNDAFENLIYLMKAHPRDERLKSALQVLTDISTRLLRGERLSGVDQFILDAYARRAA